MTDPLVRLMRRLGAWHRIALCWRKRAHEAMRKLDKASCLWCGFESTKSDMEALSEHILGCEKNPTSIALREAAIAWSLVGTAVRALRCAEWALVGYGSKLGSSQAYGARLALEAALTKRGATPDPDGGLPVPAEYVERVMSEEVLRAEPIWMPIDRVRPPAPGALISDHPYTPHAYAPFAAHRDICDQKILDDSGRAALCGRRRVEHTDAPANPPPSPTGDAE